MDLVTLYVLHIKKLAVSVETLAQRCVTVVRNPVITKWGI